MRCLLQSKKIAMMTSYNPYILKVFNSNEFYCNVSINNNLVDYEI